MTTPRWAGGAVTVQEGLAGIPNSPSLSRTSPSRPPLSQIPTSKGNGGDPVIEHRCSVPATNPVVEVTAKGCEVLHRSDRCPAIAVSSLLLELTRGAIR